MMQFLVATEKQKKSLLQVKVLPFYIKRRMNITSDNKVQGDKNIYICRKTFVLLLLFNARGRKKCVINVYQKNIYVTR